MFLNYELFWMNNKTIIEFGFRIIWRIVEISEGVIHLGLQPRRITPFSISIILHKILSLIHQLFNIKLSKPLHLILILIHVSLFRYNKLILCLLILYMVLYLSINFNLKKKKVKRNTLENQNHNLLADPFRALSLVSLPWMFMGEEHYNEALRTSLWDAKMYKYLSFWCVWRGPCPWVPPVSLMATICRDILLKHFQNIKKLIKINRILQS